MTKIRGMNDKTQAVILAMDIKLVLIPFLNPMIHDCALFIGIIYNCESFAMSGVSQCKAS